MNPLDSKNIWLYILPFTALGVASYSLWVESSPLSNSGDYLSLHVPYKHFLKETIFSGHLPLWNPYQSLGRPFIGDLEAGTFYPTVPFFLILPQALAIFAALILHFWMALHFTQKLLLLFQCTHKTGYLIGLAFLLSVPLQGKTLHGHMHIVQTLCLFPCLFYTISLLQEKPCIKHMLYLGLTMTMLLLAGHPQTTWTLLLGGGFFMLGRALEYPSKQNLKLFLQKISWFWTAFIFALGLSALQLLPFLHFLEQSHRKQTPWRAAKLPFDWDSAVSFFMPLKSNYWNYHEESFYAGTFFVLTGLLALRALHNKNIRGLLCVVLGGLMIGTSPHTPLFDVFFDFLPGYSRGHHQSRHGLSILFALLLLSGFWLDQIKTRRRDFVLILGALLCIALPSLLASKNADRETVQILFTCISIIFVFVYVLKKRITQKNTALFALSAMWIVFDLIHVNNVAKNNYNEDAKVEQEQSLEKFFVQNHLYKNNSVPPRASIPSMQIRENSGMVLKYSSYNSFAGLQPKRAWAYLHGIPYLDTLQFESNSVDGRIFKQGAFPMPGLSINVGLDPEKAQLIVAKKPEPRIFAANAWIHVEHYHDAIELIRNGHPLFQQPIIEEGFIPEPSPHPSNDKVCEPTIEHFSINEILVSAKCEERILLVLSEAWYPGWKAEFNGQHVDTIPVNAWMRGLVVPAGIPHIRFYFTSAPLTQGITLSLLTGLVAVFLLLRERQKKTR